MFKLLLGFAIGVIAARAYEANARGRGARAYGRMAATEGRVDELTSAVPRHEPAPVNAGDATPSRAG